jgi:exodeoxyribonuclease VII large subunit
MSEPLSVSAALALARQTLEGLTLAIVGEISDLSDNPRYKAVYFTLADEGGALSCLMWRSSFDRLGVQLKSGMQVEIRGRFTLYAAKGRMQFDVRELALAGEGQLRAQVAALAARLRARGLMDEARKQPLPEVPERIALVTSPRGKAVHDVLRTLRRRFPLARVLLFGVTVEGATAARGIIEALAAAQRSDAEVILLVRGGGSYEDLMPFNDEALAEAIAASSKPIITGIGHEPDTSIADMVADLRASTPTAAAEAATPHAEELNAQLTALQAVLATSLHRRVERQAMQLDQTALRLDSALPTGLATARHTLDAIGLHFAALQASLFLPLRTTAQRHAQSLRHIGLGLTAAPTSLVARSAAALESLSPLSVLSRGYAIGYDEQGRVLRSIAQTAEGQSLRVHLIDGSIETRVQGIKKKERT